MKMTPEAQTAAARLAADYVEQAHDKDGELSTASVYAEERGTTEILMLEGNGPTLYVTFVKERGDIAYAVFEFIDAYGKGYSVVGESDAKALHRALRRD